ncbi:unnamed protein product [Arabis nemorensis]|uniref:DUF3444 domain-containing protein n=1 Tax=Arabis nemorensis TaxID=586526 RepID=A0A565CVN2_9BRAS|nr:unnamed protein product [Arabis nemorensis]
MGLPRHYALIRTVIKKKVGFMLKLTWLEAKADDEIAKQQVRNMLPLTVGKFELGTNSELTGDEETSETPTFSHLIHCRIGSMKDSISVYPRRGETWARLRK